MLFKGDFCKNNNESMEKYTVVYTKTLRLLLWYKNRMAHNTGS